jgi:hypothetical protein
MRSNISRALLAFGLLVLGYLPNTADACSCIKVKETPAEVQAWANRIFAHPGNIVLVRATAVVPVAESHEQAKLEVIHSWKGAYRAGSFIRSDTKDVGGGMCGMSLKVGDLFLAIFETEPIRIAGCRVDGGVTQLQREHLDRLAGK